MSLCIMTPVLGSVNETYVRRHVNELLPKPSAVIAIEQPQGFPRYWAARGPTLLLPPKQQSQLSIEERQEYAARILAFWKEHKITTILVEYLQFAAHFIRLAVEHDIRLYAHAHGFDSSALIRQEDWVRKYRQLSGASGIIVVSQKMKSALNRIGIECPIRCIPCGVDVPEFVAQRSRSTAVTFLAVGRFTAKKGPIFLLDSFRRALQLNGNLRLHLIGEGQMLDAAVQFVQAFRLESAVSFHGNQPHTIVKKFMGECDAFVQHSVVSASNGDEEGLPVVILEAMAAALPVISTFHAGIPEAVLDGVTGYLVAERDTEAMADRMLALAADQELRRQMGMNGRERVKAAFTWERERHDLLDMLGLGNESAVLRLSDRPESVTPE